MSWQEKGAKYTADKERSFAEGDRRVRSWKEKHPTKQLPDQLERKIRQGWTDDSAIATVGRKDVFHQRLYRGDGFASAFCQSNFGDCIGDPPEFIRQVKHADGSESTLVTGFETKEEYDRAELNSLLLGYAKITSM